MSPPIRDGSGNSIGSIRLGDGSEISEVRTGAGDVVFSSVPDSIDYDALGTGQTDNQSQAEGGVVINPNVQLSGLNPTVGWNNQNRPADIVVIEGGINGTEILRKSLSGTASGETIKLAVTLDANTDYAVVGDNGGSKWTYDHGGGDTSFPQTSSPNGDFDLVAGVDDGTQGASVKTGFVDPITELI